MVAGHFIPSHGGQEFVDAARAIFRGVPTCLISPHGDQNTGTHSRGRASPGAIHIVSVGMGMRVILWDDVSGDARLRKAPKGQNETARGIARFGMTKYL